MDKNNVVPSGSISVLDFDQAPADDGQGNATAREPDNQGAINEQRMFAGRFKSPDELEKSYISLEQKLGKHGEELGMLRGQNQQLMEMLKSQQAGQQQAQPSAGQEDKIASIVEAYGKLDFLEDPDAASKGANLLLQAIRATKDEVMSEAQNKFSSILTEKEAEKLRTRFIEENPDFVEMQNQGVFQSMKTKNPLHDDFSAYYALKSAKASEQIAALQAQLDEAKRIANLAGGDSGTAKVYTKPGGEIAAKSKPRTITELKQSALDAVRRAKGA